MLKSSNFEERLERARAARSAVLAAKKDASDGASADALLAARLQRRRPQESGEPPAFEEAQRPFVEKASAVAALSMDRPVRGEDAGEVPVEPLPSADEALAPDAPPGVPLKPARTAAGVTLPVRSGPLLATGFALGLGIGIGFGAVTLMPRLFPPDGREVASQAASRGPAEVGVATPPTAEVPGTGAGDEAAGPPGPEAGSGTPDVPAAGLPRTFDVAAASPPSSGAPARGTGEGARPADTDPVVRSEALPAGAAPAVGRSVQAAAGAGPTAEVLRMTSEGALRAPGSVAPALAASGPERAAPARSTAAPALAAALPGEAALAAATPAGRPATAPMPAALPGMTPTGSTPDPVMAISEAPMRPGGVVASTVAPLPAVSAELRASLAPPTGRPRASIGAPRTLGSAAGADRLAVAAVAPEPAAWRAPGGLAAPRVPPGMPSLDTAPPSPGNLLSVIVHRPELTPAEVADSAVRTIEAAGDATGAVRVVDLTINSRQLRYFHAEDAERGAALAEALGARLRDFTAYRPSPERGTVELWLAGRGEPDAVVSRPAGRSATVGARPARREAPSNEVLIQTLRDRLVQRLRRGDHL